MQKILNPVTTRYRRAFIFVLFFSPVFLCVPAPFMVFAAEEMTSISAEDYLNRAQLYDKKGENDKAAEYYQIYLQSKPNDALANIALGVIYNKLGQVKDAKPCFEKAVKIEPKNADAYYYLAVAYSSLGPLEEAKKNFEKAISLNPEHYFAYQSLGNIFAAMGKTKEAKNCLLKAKDLLQKRREMKLVGEIETRIKEISEPKK